MKKITTGMQGCAKRQSDPLPYCERHDHHYIRTCRYCAAEDRLNINPIDGAICVIQNMVSDPLARTKCNACVQAPAAVEVRFGHPERATSILCVALCASCRDSLARLLVRSTQP